MMERVWVNKHVDDVIQAIHNEFRIYSDVRQEVIVLYFKSDIIFDF